MLRLISLCLLAAAVSGCHLYDPTTTTTTTTTTARPCRRCRLIPPCQQDVPTAAPCPTTPAPCVYDAPTTAAPCPTTPAPCQADVPAPCINDRGLPCFPVQHDDEMPDPVDWTRHDLERLKKPCPLADVPRCPLADVPPCQAAAPPCQADVPAPCQADVPAPCGCPSHDDLPLCEADELPCGYDEAVVPENFKCDDGWTRHDTSCYLISEEATGFEAAENACTKLGGSLTVVNSIDEFKEVIQKLGPLNTFTWTGMKKSSEDAEPIYMAKTEMDYKTLPWLIQDAGYVANGWSQYANCAASFNPAGDYGKYVYWYPCSYNFRYICEKNAILAASDVAHI